MTAHILRIFVFAVMAGLVPLGKTAFAEDAPAAAAKTPALPDVDAMAARLKTHTDVYEKIRDEALAEYAKRNPTAHPYDDKAKTLLRLFAYLCVWNDFYREGLWEHGVSYAHDAMALGATDPILRNYLNVEETGGFSSSSEEDAERFNHDSDAFLATGYPALFKLRVCLATLDNLANFKTNRQPPPDAPSMLARNYYVAQWGVNYRELLKQNFNHEVLYDTGDDAMESAESDEELLDLIIAELDRDYNEIDPRNPVKLELDGAFYVHDAWHARGSGWANTVSQDGWKQFGERLDKAAQILEPLYDQFPNETGTCHAMMTVELGQGQGRDRMEKWFQRAIKADPEDYAAYKSKEWYLLPRWYGSSDDILAFGKECVSGGDWAAKIPMILPTGIAESGNGDPSLYTDPDIWALLEKVYREYLARYPNAINYRTNFAMHAYDGGHKDVAREQFKILGGGWDRSVLTEARYATIMSDLNSK
jgi:hypothetical protein